jgi:CheY-like chemotaxis protein
MEGKIDRKLITILVVEDHPLLLQFMGLALTILGWNVITSSSGQEAVDKLKHNRPNLIILDMRMPDMDGFELTQILKRDPSYRDIPILAVTGLDSGDIRNFCLHAGCDDLLSKPFSLPELQGRMMRILLAKGLGERETFVE